MVKTQVLSLKQQLTTRSVYTTNKLLHQIKTIFCLAKLCLEDETEARLFRTLTKLAVVTKMCISAMS